MKRIWLILFILAAFVGCEKEEDDTSNELTSGYTTINGYIIKSQFWILASPFLMLTTTNS